MLTPADINQFLESYVKTTDGKQVLAKAGVTAGYSDTEMKSIATELRDSIISAYKQSRIEPNPYFNVKATRVNNPTKPKDGKCKITISFSDAALFRRSLCSDFAKKSYNGKTSLYSKTSTGSGRFTGEGVYDIFGLLTMGYSARTAVYGTWWDNEHDDGDRGELRWSLRNRKGDPFIINAVEAFKVKYPDVEITLPDNWVA